MKKFVLFIASIIGLTIGILVLADLLYSTAYGSYNQRNKINNVYHSKNKTFDVVILGSSRAENHFVSSMFQEKGINAFNYGISSSHLFESALLLQMMMERNYTIKNVIVEVDLNLRSDTPGPIIAKFLPYLHQENGISNHLKKLPDFFWLYYIPFYRYIEYDAIIGFREFFFTTIRKSTYDFFKNYGYRALMNEGSNLKYNLGGMYPHKNESYELIKAICKRHHINLIAVTTPMCRNVTHPEYFDEVQKMYPEIHRYDAVVTEDRFFSSCGHMNDAGAKLFTGIILNDFFKK